MDFWMLARNELPNDLMDIFSALGDLQYQYDWIISDHDLYFAPDTPDSVRERWSWTGLLMDGQELTRHLSSGYVHFVAGGILSAVPKGTIGWQVREYLPGWEIDQFGDPDYCFQTPLTQLEVLCYDGYAWCIICKPEMSPEIKRALPNTKSPDEFYRSMQP